MWVGKWQVCLNRQGEMRYVSIQNENVCGQFKMSMAGKATQMGNKNIQITRWLAPDELKGSKFAVVKRMTHNQGHFLGCRPTENHCYVNPWPVFVDVSSMHILNRLWSSARSNSHHKQAHVNCTPVKCRKSVTGNVHRLLGCHSQHTHIHLETCNGKNIKYKEISSPPLFFTLL